MTDLNKLIELKTHKKIAELVEDINQLKGDLKYYKELYNDLLAKQIGIGKKLPKKNR